VPLFSKSLAQKIRHATFVFHYQYSHIHLGVYCNPQSRVFAPGFSCPSASAFAAQGMRP
jgi:hypothetical protein